MGTVTDGTQPNVAGHGCALYNEFVYSFGGENTSLNDAKGSKCYANYTHCQVIDWVLELEAPHVIAIDDIILILGGYVDESCKYFGCRSDEWLNLYQFYDPITDMQLPTASLQNLPTVSLFTMPVREHLMTAFFSTEKLLYIFGGNTNGFITVWEFRNIPTPSPTATPTINTNTPTRYPTGVNETLSPSVTPTEVTINPSKNPSIPPTTNPSTNPSQKPTSNTAMPSKNPTQQPISTSISPTLTPSQTPVVCQQFIFYFFVILRNTFFV